MTREELITNLKYTMKKHENDTVRTFGTNISLMCKDMLDYLEQEPTTKNDLGVDCISRADARSLICDIDLKHHTFGMSRKAFKDLYNGMDDLPSVTPQPKTGHWIANAPQYDMLNPQYICSECGNAHTRITPYCEMCGAKMVELQESEDNNA